MGGYRFVTNYMEQQQSAQLEVQLDNKQYDETALIEVRVPVNLPYQTDWKEFERVDGEVEFNGMHYKFVERKLQGGEMIYKCIPNEGKELLVNARENFFKLVNDLQTQQSSNKKSASNNHSVKTFSFDYCEKSIQFHLSSLDAVVKNHISHSAAAIRSAFLISPEQPPEA
jgi:capsid protein